MTHVNDSPVNTHHWVSVQHTPRPYPMPAARPGMSGQGARNA